MNFLQIHLSVQFSWISHSPKFRILVKWRGPKWNLQDSFIRPHMLKPLEILLAGREIQFSFLCVHVTLNAKTTLVQSIESVQLMCSFWLSLWLKVYIALLRLSWRSLMALSYTSLSLNGRCKIYLYCRDCGWFLIWL